MPLWIKNGKLIINDEGKLIICDHCPCGGHSSESSAASCSVPTSLNFKVWRITGGFEDDCDFEQVSCISVTTAADPIVVPNQDGSVTYWCIIEAEVGDSCGWHPAGTYSCDKYSPEPPNCVLGITCKDNKYSLTGDNRLFLHDVGTGENLVTFYAVALPTISKEYLDCTSIDLRTFDYILQVI